MFFGGQTAGYFTLTSITGCLAPEWVACIQRNKWLACSGITGLHGADFTLDTSTVNKFITETIEPGSKVQTDDLSIYSSLDKHGINHEIYPIIFGEKSLPWVHTIISNAKAFILGTYHGRMAPKHLQSYLDEFCYRFNRRHWDNQLFTRLLSACINCKITTYLELIQ